MNTWEAISIPGDSTRCVHCITPSHFSSSPSFSTWSFSFILSFIYFYTWQLHGYFFPIQWMLIMCHMSELIQCLHENGSVTVRQLSLGNSYCCTLHIPLMTWWCSNHSDVAVFQTSINAIMGPGPRHQMANERTHVSVAHRPCCFLCTLLPLYKTNQRPWQCCLLVARYSEPKVREEVTQNRPHLTHSLPDLYVATVPRASHRWGGWDGGL